MKKIITQTCIATAALLIMSCQINPCGLSKDKFLDNYEDFIDEVTDLDLEYKAKAWDRYDDKFEQFTDHCYPKFEDDLNSRQERQFASNTVRFLFARHGKSFFKELESNERLNEELEEIRDQIEKYAEKYGEAISSAVEEFVDQIDRETLNEAFKQVGDFFDNLEIQINTKDKK